MALSFVALGSLCSIARGEDEGLLADARSRHSLAPPRQAAITPAGYLQFRALWNHRDDVPGDDATGFQLARGVLGLEAELSDTTTALILGEFGPDGSFVLKDALARHRLSGDLALAVGQFQLPFSRECMVGDTGLLAVDRSVSESFFGLGRTQGVVLTRRSDETRWWASINDGRGALGTDILAPAEADLALTLRAEYKVEGLWEQFDDFTSFNSGTRGLLLGAAAHGQTGGQTAGSTDADLWALTGDISYEAGGWNVFTSLTWGHTDAAGTPGFDDLGLVIQGGLFVTDAWELFARCDAIFPDTDRSADPDVFTALTIGANHYFFPESHAAKLTLEGQYFLGEQADSIAPPGPLSGLLGSTEGSQFTARLQLQLVF